MGANQRKKKMKNKKILTTIGVLFLSAIAATSGTFAWFITSREASIQYSGARIYTTDGDLMIDYKSSFNSINEATDVTHEPNTNVLTIANNQKVTDISGDGLSFYKVNWSSIDNVASDISEVSVAAAGDADGFFVDFTVTISRATGSAGFKAFLGDDTAILPVDDTKPADVGIVKAARMVVINYDDNDSETGDSEVIIRYGVDAEVGPKYLIEEAGGEAYDSGTHSFQGDALYKSAAFSTESTIAASEAIYPTIADLMDEDVTSADVTFRFFIEGTDPDAKSEYLQGKFKVNLDIYALYA